MGLDLLDGTLLMLSLTIFSFIFTVSPTFIAFKGFNNFLGCEISSVVFISAKEEEEEEKTRKCKRSKANRVNKGLAMVFMVVLAKWCGAEMMLNRMVLGSLKRSCLEDHFSVVSMKTRLQIYFNRCPPSSSQKVWLIASMKQDN